MQFCKWSGDDGEIESTIRIQSPLQKPIYDRILRYVRQQRMNGMQFSGSISKLGLGIGELIAADAESTEGTFEAYRTNEEEERANKSP